MKFNDKETGRSFGNHCGTQFIFYPCFSDWEQNIFEGNLWESLEFVVNLSSKDGAKIEKQQMGWEAIHCWEQLIGAKSDPSEQIWQQVGSYHRPTRASLPLWRRVVERKLFQPTHLWPISATGWSSAWSRTQWWGWSPVNKRFWFDGRSRDKGDFFGNRIFQEKVFSTEI